MTPDLQTAAPPASSTWLEGITRFVIAFRQVCEGYMLPSPGC